MAALINQFGKSATVSMFLCIIVYMVLQIGGIFIPQLSALLFTGYLQWHNIWLGTTLPFGTVIGKIALLLGYGLVFSAAAISCSCAARSRAKAERRQEVRICLSDARC